MSQSQINVSVVFSFRNEEESIPLLIERTTKALQHLNFELIFVNDNSTDRSKQLLVDFHAKDKRIKIIDMSRRFGVTPCILAGLMHACGEAVVNIDADMQDPPELIPALYEKMKKERLDVIHTVRTKRVGEPKLKMFMTKLAYKVINRFSEIQLVENAGDFKMFNQRALRRILELKEYDPYMRGLSVWVGFDQGYFKYERDARPLGETKFPLLSLNPYKEFIRGLTSFSVLPLYFSVFLGLFFSCFSGLAILGLIIYKLNGNSLPGWTAIMTTIFFFSGIILLILGILGIYIGKIYKEVQSRPKFLIKELVGFNESSVIDKDVVHLETHNR